MMADFGLPVISGGSRGGLRVLKHPPKLPKVNYLLLLLITVNSLSDIITS